MLTKARKMLQMNVHFQNVLSELLLVEAGQKTTGLKKVGHHSVKRNIKDFGLSLCSLKDIGFKIVDKFVALRDITSDKVAFQAAGNSVWTEIHKWNARELAYNKHLSGDIDANIITGLNQDLNAYSMEVTNYINSHSKVSNQIIDELQRAFRNQKYPMKDSRGRILFNYEVIPCLQAFGSSANTLGSSKSDLDLTLSLYYRKIDNNNNNDNDATTTTTGIDTCNLLNIILDNRHNGQKIRRGGKGAVTKPVLHTDGVSNSNNANAISKNTSLQVEESVPGFKVTSALQLTANAISGIKNSRSESGKDSKNSFEINEIVSFARIPIIKLTHLASNTAVSVHYI